MFGLPKKTEFNKKIPKQKFYENMDISPAIKKVFVEQVKAIYWRNKIATTTVNLAPGQNVTELEVFEIRLSSPTLDEGMLRQIDKEIPYHLIFLLEYQGKYQVWIGYKEATVSGTSAFKVNKYFHTEWLEEENISIKIEGLDIDAVYENFVKQIAGKQLLIDETEESIKEALAKNEEREKILKQIDRLLKLIKKEKQINKQIKLNGELKKLKAQLEAL